MMENPWPDTIQDDRYGIFRRSPDWPNCYTNWREFQGQQISSDLLFDRELPFDEHRKTGALKVLDGFWKHFDDWDTRFRDAIQRYYFKRWKEDWPAPDKPELSADGFKSRFVLTEVMADETGDFDATYEAEDLFLDHRMTVSYYADNGRIEATLYGWDGAK